VTALIKGYLVSPGRIIESIGGLFGLGKTVLYSFSDIVTYLLGEDHEIRNGTHVDSGLRMLWLRTSIVYVILPILLSISYDVYSIMEVVGYKYNNPG
jgi:hypothetical protein